MVKTFATVIIVLSTLAWAKAQTIPEQIDAILARSTLSGNTWTIAIENAPGTLRYYQKNPTTGKAPASNTKLVTTAAAFALLGTNYAFETRVYLDGSLAAGTLTGNLNLVSEHDMTWNTSVFSGNARRALDFIAGKLKTNGLTRVTGNVQCYGVCIYNYGSTDNTKDTSNQGTYNAEAATAFVAALRAQGITIDGTAQGRTGFSPPGNLFYTHKSSDLTYGGKPLRMDVACIPLNKVSHNPMADALLRHIGYKQSGTDSFTAGRNQVFNWLSNTVGIATNSITMLDGSGLSWNNSFSANQILQLTRYMLGAYPTWDDTLPIGCVDGTIGSRFCGTAGSGKVHAKTGTLSISVALSGYIDNPSDNQRYLFSFIANHPSNIDETATRSAIDECVVLLGARGVPTGPQILAVTNRANGKAINVTWSDMDFVNSGYRVYRSSDGVTFGSPVDVGANVHTFTEGSLAAGQQRFYRVTALGAGGESPFSRVYGAQVDPNPSPILVVDGNDRWQFVPSKNPTAANHSFAAVAGRSISGPAFDTVHHSAVESGAIALTNYSSVIWLLGEESTQDETFNAVEQTLVKDFLNAGGNLFVSGAEVGWDLDRDSGPLTADRNFYRNYLRATLNGDANDDANTYAFAAASAGIFAGNPAGNFDNGSMIYNVAFPDVLTPTNGSSVALNYVGGRGGAAAIFHNGTANRGKVVNFGFPFESITDPAVRQAYMSDILRFFDLIAPPKLITSQAGNVLTFAWNTSAGLRYRLEYKTNLSQPGWIPLSTVTATNTSVTIPDPLTAGPRFYRVQLLD